MAVLAHSRDAEREADLEGLRLLERAEVEPEGLLTFFGRLSEGQGQLGEALAFLSTHPGGGERVSRLREEIDRGHAVADGRLLLGLGPDHEARLVLEVDHRHVEGVAELDEAARLLRGAGRALVHEHGDTLAVALAEDAVE